MKILIRIDLEPDETELPEARAVQVLQNALAAAANESPEALVQLWRLALEDFAQSVRPKHKHRRAK